MKPASVDPALLVAWVASTSQANAADRHLLGCGIEGMDDPRDKAHEQLVQSLRDRGFTVHCNLRPADVGDSDATVQAHAAQISSDIKATIDYAAVRGRMLSVYDTADEQFGYCAGHQPAGASFREVVLATGEGHGVFRTTAAKRLTLGFDPMHEWSGGQKSASRAAPNAMEVPR